MIERHETRQLVIATLSENGTMRAIEIYEKVSQTAPHLFRREKIRGFRSFVKIINTFPQIEQFGNRTKEYAVAKDFKGKI